MTILWLNLLIFVPIMMYRVARHKFPRHVCRITGAALGAVIAPFSLGLYGCFFIPVIGFVPGILGLLLVMLHESPGYHLAVSLELVHAGVVVSGLEQRTIVEILNGIIWLLFYGFIGHVLDYFRARRKGPRGQVP